MPPRSPAAIPTIDEIVPRSCSSSDVEPISFLLTVDLPAVRADEYSPADGEAGIGSRQVGPRSRDRRRAATSHAVQELVEVALAKSQLVTTRQHRPPMPPSSRPPLDLHARPPSQRVDMADPQSRNLFEGWNVVPARASEQQAREEWLQVLPGSVSASSRTRQEVRRCWVLQREASDTRIRGGVGLPERPAVKG